MPATASLLVQCLLYASPAPLCPEQGPGVVLDIRDAVNDIRPRKADAYWPKGPHLSSLEKASRFDEIIIDQSRLNGLDPRLVKAVIQAESEFSIGSVSPKGARGLMQVMPRTGEEMGVSRWDLSNPESNIRAGTAYLKFLFDAAWRQYKLRGDFRAAPAWVKRRVIAAYHGGPRLLGRRHWPRDTRLYVREVLRLSKSPASSLRPPWPWIDPPARNTLSLDRLARHHPDSCRPRDLP